MGGALAAKPRVGGHTWVFLQYLLGLGWDVLFVDRLDLEASADIEYAAAVLRLRVRGVVRDPRQGH
ncbi:MAG: hypothetical protein M3R46_15610 [Actinomycetota bacterium]|nr:hypothetical protein [Actinomycetota bacterium]